MASKGAKSKTRAPDTTHKENDYLQDLVGRKCTVTVKLEDNSECDGVVEFFDATFLRLTRDGDPNLFIYKDQIKYLFETPA